MTDKQLPARFFESDTGRIPVRDWLLELWEIRINLAGRRIARVFFCVHDSSMVLLHGFIKKSQKTPAHELDVAVKRVKGLEK